VHQGGLYEVAKHESIITDGPVESIRAALLRCKQSFLTAGFISFFINLLVLVPMVYMMQVYDRVMTSSSLSTLSMLTILLVFLLMMMGLLEWVGNPPIIGMNQK